jgi:hypothetical protein
MEPVFAVHALCHKIELNFFVVLVAGEITVTVNVEEGLVVPIFSVFVVFVCLKLAAERLTRVSTITPERSLAVELINFVTFMAH